jgi:FixJ family two-component response regulator
MNNRVSRRQQTALRILLVDDNEGEYLLVRDLLNRFPQRAIALDWVTASEHALRTFRESGAHDLYLIDYKLLDHTGLDVLKSLRECGCRAPLLMLTSHSDDAIDRKAMRAGAADYLIKSEMTRPLIQRAIRHALERADLAKALRESEERYRSLARNFPNGCILVIDHDGRVQLAEGTALGTLLGVENGDGSLLLGKFLRGNIPAVLADIIVRETASALTGKLAALEHEHHGRRWLISTAPQHRFDAPAIAVVVIKDITSLRSETGGNIRSTNLNNLLDALGTLSQQNALPPQLQEAYDAMAGAPSTISPDAP